MFFDNTDTNKPNEKEKQNSLFFLVKLKIYLLLITTRQIMVHGRTCNQPYPIFNRYRIN
jgi:hypothetical protein